MSRSERNALIVRAKALGWWPTEVVDDQGRVMWGRPDRHGVEALEAWTVGPANGLHVDDQLVPRQVAA
jgi:hypothetical protein